jgi:nucleoside 2-deoxyribosyltransferase
MPKCFVIQPFDGADFDRRYDETVRPAIERAGFEPQRIDRDPRATIVIVDIERAIRAADACIADITLDNPNVWYELGFAIACNKPVVLLANEKKRKQFPFDIQHRSVLRYRTDSAGDFKNLGREITTRLAAVFPSATALLAEKAKASLGVARDAAATTLVQSLDDEKVRRVVREKTPFLVGAAVAGISAGVAALVRNRRKAKPEKKPAKKPKPSK